MKRIFLFPIAIIIVLVVMSSAFADDMHFPKIGMTIDVIQGWNAKEQSITKNWSSDIKGGTEVYMIDNDNSSYMYVFIASRKYVNGDVVNLRDMTNIYMNLLEGHDMSQYRDGGYTFRYTPTIEEYNPKPDDPDNIESTAYVLDSNKYIDLPSDYYCFIRTRAKNNSALDQISHMMDSLSFESYGTASEGSGGGGCNTGYGTIGLLIMNAALLFKRR